MRLPPAHQDHGGVPFNDGIEVVTESGAAVRRSAVTSMWQIFLIATNGSFGPGLDKLPRGSFADLPPGTTRPRANAGRLSLLEGGLAHEAVDASEPLPPPDQLILQSPPIGRPRHRRSISPASATSALKRRLNRFRAQLEW